MHRQFTNLSPSAKITRKNEKQEKEEEEGKESATAAAHPERKPKERIENRTITGVN